MKMSLFLLLKIVSKKTLKRDDDLGVAVKILDDDTPHLAIGTGYAGRR